MRVGFISTRLSGTDGVSLEVEKWAKIFQDQGHDLFYCAGEISGYAKDGTLIPLMHFKHSKILQFNDCAFGVESDPDSENLIAEMQKVAAEIKRPLLNFIQGNALDLIVLENALTIPMNIPLGMALTEIIAETEVDTIAHHHDFYWERERFQSCGIFDLLDQTFPPQYPNMRHVTINSIAKHRLKARSGIDSVVIPNVFDFDTPPPNIDSYNKDLRTAIGIPSDATLILQPTRVVRRKGIELALILVHQLELDNCYLVIPHDIRDEGEGYFHWLVREAEILGVQLRLINDVIDTERSMKNGNKVYSLWDVYPHADFVTYPSLIEGFGNALLEAIYFKQPIVVNQYSVYMADIRPLGFDFVELAGYVDQSNVEEVKFLLTNREKAKEIAEHNYEIARHHFSYRTLRKKLNEVISTFS